MRNVASLEVGFVVRDLDAVLPFYTDVLGFTILSDIDVPAAKSAPTGLSPPGYRVVRLLTDRGDRVKLTQPKSGLQLGTEAAYAMQREGAAYVTFLVEDLVALHARLQASGVAIRSEGVVALRPGVSLLLATDPAGNFLEFVEYADVAAYLTPAAR